MVEGQHPGEEEHRHQGSQDPTSRGQQHGHAHGALDRVVLSSSRGIWATKVSLVVLLATASMQVVIVVFTGSVALLADTIHNFGDAATALPLWAAFTLAGRRPTRRFTYGYGRAEDLAGLLIVGSILVTGVIAAYVSITRLNDPPEIDFLWAVVVASVVGFVGNEAVALFRIKIGKEIGSAALVADGLHARVDGLTSLAVLVGAIGVWLGAPLADPIIGLVITVAIFRIVIESGKSVISRLLDGVEPEVGDEIRQVLDATEGVEEVTEIRVRWLGHRLLAEVNVAVRPDLSVEKGHEIAQEAHHRLLDRLQYLSSATVHVDPVGSSGEEYHHRAAAHQDDNNGEAGSHTH
jgi:cation diffusion facilitator family transporter